MGASTTRTRKPQAKLTPFKIGARLAELTPLGKKIEKAMKDRSVTVKILTQNRIVTGNTLTKIKTGQNVNQQKLDSLLVFLGLKEGGKHLPVVSSFVEERDNVVRGFIGGLPKTGAENQVFINGTQYVRHDCPMCKCEGYLWVPIQ